MTKWLTRRLGFLAACSAVFAAARLRAVDAPAGGPAAKADRVVVVMSVDGLAGFYFDDPKAEMPNIRALAAAGARASGMEAVTPTVTWPNHTTLVTGDFPARHGVAGNNYLDRATAKSVALIADPLFDKDQIVKVPTIYDLAKAAGMKTAAVKWPATRNAKTLDWTTPDCGKDSLVLKYSTPELLKECADAGIIRPLTDVIPDPDATDPKKVEEKPAGEKADAPAAGGNAAAGTAAADDKAAAGKKAADARKKSTARFDDRASTEAFKLILRNHRPGLALLHVTEVDHMEHLDGPRSPGAYEAIKKADEQVGEVWAEMKRDFPGRATLVVVSDHGFSPIERLVLPNVILRDAGLVQVKGVRVVGGSVRCVVQGGAAMIYVLDADRRDEVVKQVTKAFAGVKGVYKVAGPADMKDYGVADPAADPHAPDMVVFADEGCAFGDTAAGALTFTEKPERKGTHGHDPHLPHLQATFVAAGLGIKPGVSLGVVRNVDVAPTVARLLGLKMDDVDGKPMTAILDESALPAVPAAEGR